MDRTVVALYNDFETARRAVEDLVASGFARDHISMVANDDTGRYTQYIENDNDVSAGEGAGFGAVIGTLIGLGMAVIPGLGPVLAAGPLGAAIFAGIGAASGAVTGGLAAGLIDLGMDESTARYYEEGVRTGGTLVSVSTYNTEDTVSAERILNNYNPVRMGEKTY